MSESTTRHDHAAEPAGLNPFFREPALDETWARVQERKSAVDEAYDRTAAALGAELAAGAPEPPAAPAGPEPVLEGTFAIYVTPDQALVVAYRPRGAVADKQFVVPAFLINLATQRSGHSLADVVKGLKEQGE